MLRCGATLDCAAKLSQSASRHSRPTWSTYAGAATHLASLQGDGVKSIIIPGIVGVVLGLALGMLIFYT